jgi:ABC-type glycerol-3-phosphate transport system permease component
MSEGRRRPRRLGRRAGELVRGLLLALSSAAALYPVVWLVAVSLKSKAQYAAEKLFFSWPPFLGNLLAALQGGRFLLWFLNSAIMTVGSVLLCTLVAFFAAFAFAKMSFRGRQLIMNLNISLMVIPVAVLIVPLFVLYTRTHLMSTYPGLILIYAAVCLPFSVYLLTNFFRTVPDGIMEAGVIDGASILQILSRIVIPLSGPPITTLIVVNALWVWNELLLALVFLPKDDLRTLMVGITVFKSRYNLDVPVTMAGLLLTTLPMVVLYVVFQRVFIRGLTAGALKG